MTFKGKINAVRAKIMRKLTKNVGSSDESRSIDFTEIKRIKRVLVIRPNHRLGNLLLITPLIQEISALFPDAKIDLFVKGSLTPVVFKNYPAIERIIELPSKPFKDLYRYLKGWISIRSKAYDLIINVDRNSSSGKLSAKFANGRHKIFGFIDERLIAQRDGYEHIARYPVFVLRNILSDHTLIENAPVPILSIKLSTQELAEGKSILKNLVQNDKKTICLFTNATGTKIYSEEWWEELYQKLTNQFPDCNIIEILPIENRSQIGFKALTYANKNVRTVGSVIASADVFIGADSGMMHLASSVDTPTIGLFKSINTKVYEPYNKNSVGFSTEINSIDDCIGIIRKLV